MKLNIYKLASGFLLLLIFNSFSLLRAQGDLELEWAKSLGGPESDESYSLVVDDNRNVYTTGHFSGTADFDPGEEEFLLTSNGERDVYISKLDSDGNFVWASSFGGESADESYSISLDLEGNIYITGAFMGTVDFNPGEESNEITAFGKDIFVLKLDNDGSYTWAKNMGSPGNENLSNAGVLKSIKIDDDQNVYLTGSFENTVDFDPGEGEESVTSAGGFDIYITKLNAEGDLVWNKTIGSDGSDESNFLTIDQGSVYITGSFVGTVDFDPSEEESTLTSIGGQDMFVAKFDTDGNFQWARNMGGGNVNVSLSIAVNNETTHGNIYITGYFIGATDFDPGEDTFQLSVTGGGGIDIFVCKLNPEGDFLWARNIGSVANDLATYIVANSDEELFITGYYEAPMTFDPETGLEDLTPSGSSDTFIMMLTADGDIEFAKSIGGIGNDFGSSITTDDDGYIYASGSFTGTADFDTGEDEFNITSAGEGDVFVLKLNRVCNLDNSATADEANLSAVLEDAQYQWIDCENGEAIDNATEQTFTATTNGDYAVIITQGNCSVTSECMNVSGLVGVGELHEETAMVLFPNPANDHVTISFSHNLQGVQILLMNINGQIIEQRSSHKEKSLDIDLSEYESGIYLVQMIADQKTFTKKLVKK